MPKHAHVSVAQGCEEVLARFRGLATAHLFSQATEVGGALPVVKQMRHLQVLHVTMRPASKELGAVLATFRQNARCLRHEVRAADIKAAAASIAPAWQETWESGKGAVKMR